MSRSSALFRALLALLAVVLAEKLLFVFHHAELRAGLSLEEIGMALLSGLRFDLAAVALFVLGAYLPAYLYSRLLRRRFAEALRVTLFVAAGGLVALHGADLIYFDESGRHMGYELKEAYNSRSELFSAALRSYRQELLVQLLFAVAALLVVRALFPAPDRRQRRMFAPPRRWWEYVAPEGHLIVTLLLLALLVRGGIQSVPLEPLHAQDLGDPRKAAIALNGPYNAIFSSLTPYAVERVLVDAPTEAQRARVRAIYRDEGAPPASRVDGANVVVILLEGWSASQIHSYGAAETTTPFFDEWRARSFTSREMLAGGHRTTEGMFATFCSAQNPLGATIAQSQLQNYAYDCLPKLLREKGYHTAFFQGTVSGTSGTGAFAQLLGFEESQGREHVAHHRIPYNSWGMHDADIYGHVMQRLPEMRQPFLVAINTNSTHDLTLPPGTAEHFKPDTPSGRYRNVLHYADAALRDFVVALKASYPDTVIVALADHAGPSAGETIDRYRIPFVIDAAALTGQRDEVASQRDVAPTLLDLLGIPPPRWFTGRSLLRPGPGAADYYEAGLLGWVQGETGVEFPIRRPDQLRCFSTRPGFEAIPCGEGASEVAENGLAATTLFQDLLFSGSLRKFSAMR